MQDDVAHHHAVISGSTCTLDTMKSVILTVPVMQQVFVLQMGQWHAPWILKKMQILSIFYQIALEHPTESRKVEQHMAAISNDILAYQQLDIYDGSTKSYPKTEHTINESKTLVALQESPSRSGI